MAGSWSNSAQNLIVLVEEISGYSGIFGYSPAPGAGNLVFSLAAAAGTDPYGNTYPNGLSIGSNSTRQIVLNYDGSQAAIGFHANDGVVGVSGAIIEHLFRSGLANEYASLQIISPAMSGATESVTLQLNSQNNDGSSDANFTFSESAAGNLLSLDKTLMTVDVPLTVNGNTAVNGTMAIGGTTAVTGSITTTVAVTKNGATWQAPSLGAGWASGPSGGSFRGLHYRLDAEDNLVISGVVHTTSATPSATLFTLPAGFRPAAGERPGITFNKAGTYTAGSLEIATTGVCTVDPVPTVTSQDAYIYASVPMGNIS